MIAIYDERKGIRGKDYEIYANGTIVQFDSTSRMYNLGIYNTPEQAQYAVDQIASAIERGDKLYRMPSVEEVEKALSAKTCSKCRNYLQGKSDCLDCGLADLVNWQPKEQGGGMI